MCSVTAFKKRTISITEKVAKLKMSLQNEKDKLLDMLDKLLEMLGAHRQRREEERKKWEILF